MTTKLDIIALPAFSENYIWLMINHQQSTAVCVDPGDATPVIDYLLQHNLMLSAILITHHHWDHTNGLDQLLQNYNVPVYGLALDNGGQTKQVNQPLNNGAQVTLDSLATDITFDVITIPGHTLDHIAYFAPSVGNGDGVVFCGDTLFAAGCGRVFEGTFGQMYQSLMKLKGLPTNTQIYCAHEYTQNNLRFALTVEPDNEAIKNREQQVAALRAQGLPSIPSTLAIELETNPFLRCDKESVKQAAERYCGHALNNEVEVFTCIRQWKDQF